MSVEQIEKLKVGDKPAFNELYSEVEDTIKGAIYKYTQDRVVIEELAQDTFLKVYINIDKFREESSLTTWIYRIACNTALNYLKSLESRPVIGQSLNDEENHVDICSGGMSPEDELLYNESLGKALRTIEELPEVHKVLFKMREFEELSYQEISDKLGIPIGTVRSRLHTARKSFNKSLEL